MTIHLNMKPRQAQDIVFQSMSPETILLNLETGYYYSTNVLGAEIWQKCDGTTDIQAILNHLYQTFDVQHEELTKDTLDFIVEMIDEGLLQVDEHA